MRPHVMFDHDLLMYGTTKDVMPLREMAPAARTVWPVVFLMSDGKSCNAREDTLADACGICRSTVSAGLRDIRDAGWITKITKKRHYLSEHYHNEKTLYRPTSIGHKPHGFIEAAIVEDGTWASMDASEHAIYLVLRCLVRVDECNQAALALEKGTSPITRRKATVPGVWFDSNECLDWWRVMNYEWTASNKRRNSEMLPYIHMPDSPGYPVSLRQLAFYAGPCAPVVSKSLRRLEELKLIVLVETRRKPSRRVKRRIIMPPRYPQRNAPPPQIDYVI